MRYDRKAYVHFVAVRGTCFESGWEYREDANDRRRELKDAGIPSVVLSRVGGRRKGLDPANSAAWCSGPLVSGAESG